MRGYALRAAELAGALAGLVTALAVLLAGCALVGVGVAGGGGAAVAIVAAAVLIAVVFGCCDRLALSAMPARPVSEVEHPGLYRLVRELSKAGCCRYRACACRRPSSRTCSRSAAARVARPSAARRACSTCSTRPNCAACSGMN